MNSHQFQHSLLVTNYPILSGKIWRSEKLLQPRKWKNPALVEKKSKPITVKDDQLKVEDTQLNLTREHWEMVHAAIGQQIIQENVSEEVGYEQQMFFMAAYDHYRLRIVELTAKPRMAFNLGPRRGISTPTMDQQLSLGHYGSNVNQQILPQEDYINDRSYILPQGLLQGQGEGKGLNTNLQFLQQQSRLCKPELLLSPYLRQVPWNSHEKSMSTQEPGNLKGSQSKQTKSTMTRISGFSTAPASSVGAAILRSPRMVGNEGYHSKWTENYRDSTGTYSSGQLSICYPLRGSALGHSQGGNTKQW